MRGVVVDDVVQRHAGGHAGVAQRDDDVRHDEFYEDAEERSRNQEILRKEAETKRGEREDGAQMRLTIRCSRQPKSATPTPA